MRKDELQGFRFSLIRIFAQLDFIKLFIEVVIVPINIRCNLASYVRFFFSLQARVPSFDNGTDLEAIAGTGEESRFFLLAAMLDKEKRK